MTGEPPELAYNDEWAGMADLLHQVFERLGIECRDVEDWGLCHVLAAELRRAGYGLVQPGGPA